MITPAKNRTETIEIDLPDQELLALFKMAHEQDITFNDFVEQAILKYLEQHDNLLNELDGTSKPQLVQNTWPYPG
jgi:hypothetical protein